MTLFFFWGGGGGGRLLNFVFGRHFGFAKFRGLGRVKGIGRGRYFSSWQSQILAEFSRKPHLSFLRVFNLCLGNSK